MSSPDHSDGVQRRASWRCPDCRTLQTGTTRCWRCDTAAFTCSTCAFYRPSVAADLGSCAADTSRAPLRAEETHSCWVSSAAVTPEASVDSPSRLPPGLFADAGSTTPAPVVPAPVPAGVRAAPDRTRRRSKPPLEAPGRAAWVEPESDALVEAPMVEPGKRLVSEVRRRRRRWFR